MTVSICNELFCDFLHCKYKAYLKLTGNSGQKSDYEKLQEALLGEYRSRTEEHFLHSLRVPTTERNPDSLLEAMRCGPDAIIDANTIDENISCHFDVLVRSCPPSSRRAEYVPLLYVCGNRVTKEDKLLLAFCGIALANQQGGATSVGKIIHGPQYAVYNVQLSKLCIAASRAMQEIMAIRDDAMQAPLRLNAHCTVCEFQHHCRSTALEKDDLSLLRGLTAKEIHKLNNKGIFTVTQFSYTYRPRKKSKNAKKPCPMHRHDLQALAMRTKTIYIASAPTLPQATTRLYLDVEGLPERRSYYLIGLLVCGRQGQSFHHFWADTDANEADIWRSFLATVEPIDEFTLFHYGSYDSRWLAIMGRRHGGDGFLLERLRKASFNVLSAVYSHIYFPCYSNDLKSIASLLGFTWSDMAPSGIQSIVWRQQWEATKDASLKDALLRYNQEDCLAVHTVAEAIERVALRSVCEIGVASNPVVQTEDIKRENPYGFGTHPFFLPEMDRINRCAYFDYQRERVYLRTSNAVRQSERRRELAKRVRSHVNAEQWIDLPEECQLCGGSHLIGHGQVSKTVYDLRLMRYGLKRWIVRCKSRRLLCKQCNRAFTPKSFHRIERFGMTARAWTVYQMVALKQSARAICACLHDLFGYRGRGDVAAYLKQVAAEYYRGTYHHLLAALRVGKLVHADETKCSIKGIAGYVWAFSSMEIVAYMFRPSREGGILAEVLNGFEGVLVSDFYAAYDSVDCVQQKCLIHLIRDINDDLFKNPFDDELKDLAKRFTATLRSIVETIDKFGLTSRHLHKHKAAAIHFIEETLAAQLQSEVARGYQKRIGKYHSKLFAFLDYDGVPWNNNNAEHAVKRFVLLRNVIGGSCTVGGIEE